MELMREKDQVLSEFYMYAQQNKHLQAARSILSQQSEDNMVKKGAGDPQEFMQQIEA